MRVIESNEDDFKFERAYVDETEHGFVARAVFGGSICNIETKETLLDAGIAYCEPVDGTPLESWPVSVVVEKDNNGDPYQETLWNCTANARIVAAARKFLDLQLADKLEPGTEL